MARDRRFVINPHEIDGDVFEPGETEFDATETLPNPLDTLQVEEMPTSPSIPQVITSNQALIARTVNVPALSRAEVLSLRMPKDDLSSAFTLHVSQVGRNVSPSGQPTFLDVYDVPVSPSTGPDSVKALIEWGSGGVQNRCVLDVVPGQAVTLSGSFVRVIGINGLPATEVEISAMVSLLPRASRKTPQFTQNIGAIAGAGPTVVLGTLPPFARSVKFYRAPNTAPFVFSFRDNAGNLVSETAVTAGVEPPEVEIPGVAAAVAITNGAVAMTNVGVIYYLSL